MYDDTEGWDTMDFTDQQEFYSDFNDYDVTVRAPPKYVVWGTGTLLNPAVRLPASTASAFLKARERPTPSIGRLITPGANWRV